MAAAWGENLRKEISEYAEKYSMDLTRLCISLCGNNADAEDLFQETWYKAISRFDTYKSGYPFDKWLFAICVNTFKNRVSLFYNKKRVDFSTDEEKQAFFDSIPDKGDDPDDSYYELHRAVARLPKKLRVVLVMYYFRENSVSEVAEILNIPEGTVKSRLHSARQQIKRRLEREQ